MAIELGLLAKVGEGFIKDVYGAVKDAASKKWQTFNWHTAQGRYYKNIKENYGTTRILGKPEPIPLEGIFTDVYLLDTPAAYIRFGILQPQNELKIIEDKQKRIDGLELVSNSKSHRLYILGKPGAGKTTFLKFIALKAAQQKIKKIPIFVSLKEWADSGLGLMPFLVKQFDICHFPDAEPLIEYILEMGLAIVLFDGLDETQQESGKRDEIINSIRDFSRKYKDSQVLVTCRIAASDYTFEDFTYLEVADFTLEQVNRYVEKWFRYDKEKENQFKLEFAQDEHRGLREMASTPLLLSLLCLNFEQLGYFPQRRIEIYEEGINALLTRWDASRNIKRDKIYKGLELGRKRQMIARIAAQTFENNDYFIKKNNLVKMIVDYLSQLPDALPKSDIDGEAVLKSIEAQHSIFVERAQNIYSFSHLTFQEYFTAKYIVENTSSGTLQKLLSTEKIVDDRWYEVIVNTATLLDNANLFFELFQKNIETLIKDDRDSINILKLADKKLKSHPLNQNTPALKIFYINLELDPVNPRTDKIPFFLSDPELASLINLDIKFAQLMYAFTLHAKIWSSHSIEIGERIFESLQESLQEIIETSNNNFYRKVKAIIPDVYPTEKEMKFLSKKLEDIFLKYHSLPTIWDKVETNYRNLISYLNANDLLLDCLKIAVVSNRQRIEESLLIAPS